MPPDIDPAVDRVRARMSLEQQVGQVFMLGFDGTRVSSDTRALVHDLHLGGVTLFARNISAPGQLAQLIADLQRAADPVPLFVSIDQEGGLVVRLTHGPTVFPGNMALGAAGDVELARRVAAASASELRALGITMNLAPVLDVNTNPRNPVIGVRAFGSDPRLVARFGAATIDGLQTGGVSAVAKHFPGHGDTTVDSHFELPVVPHERARLDEVELLPFRAAIATGVDGIMTAHLAAPALEPRADVPATLAHAVLNGVLRDQLGYRGLIMTDALDMGAITSRWTPAEAAVEAFAAGADLLLIAGHTADERARLADGPRALLAAVRSGRIAGERLATSVERVLRAKARRGLLAKAVRSGDLEIVGCAEHQALALEAARRAITVLRDDARLLPLVHDQRVLVVEGRSGTGLLDALRAWAPRAFAAPAELVRSAAAEADVVVLGTRDVARDPTALAAARDLARAGSPLVGVALRGPYDALALPEVGTYLAAYGNRPVHLRAVADVVFGAHAPSGRVP